jgi:hypothetical protein
MAMAKMSGSKPTLYMLCGKIGAGKSTLANRLAERPATILISEDHWNSSLFHEELRTIKDYSRYSARLADAMGPHVIALLKAGMSVVLDFHFGPAQVDAELVRSGECRPRTALSRYTRRNLQAAPVGAKCGGRAPFPGGRRRLRAFHALFCPAGARRRL